MVEAAAAVVEAAGITSGNRILLPPVGPMMTHHLAADTKSLHHPDHMVEIVAAEGTQREATAAVQPPGTRMTVAPACPSHVLVEVAHPPVALLVALMTAAVMTAEMTAVEDHPPQHWMIPHPPSDQELAAEFHRLSQAQEA